MEGVVPFFRENVRIMLEKAAGPEMGLMVSGMGTDMIMKFI